MKIGTDVWVEEMSDLFFSTHDGFAVIRHQQQGMQSEIAALDENRILNTNVEDLVRYFADKYNLEVPKLLEDQISADQKEAQRDVSNDPHRYAFHTRRGPVFVAGAEITIEVPFSGDAQMFQIQPSTYNSAPPRGKISRNSVVFKYWSDSAAPKSVRAEFDRWLADIKQYLEWQESSFGQFNANLINEARQAIGARRAKLLNNRNLVAGLGIPLKRRPNDATTYAAPNVKRKITPAMPPVTVGPYKPEPVLEEGEYQHILGILEQMVHVMERSPKAFHNIDEESLRTFFLVNLNGHYEG